MVGEKNVEILSIAFSDNWVCGSVFHKHRRNHRGIGINLGSGKEKLQYN